MQSPPRILITVHAHGPHSGEVNEDHFNLMVGNTTTGKRGSILQALHQALLMDPNLETQLYISLSPYEVAAAYTKHKVHHIEHIATWTKALDTVINHGEAFGFHRTKEESDRAMQLLANAYFDFWEDVGTLPLNTHTEAVRYIAYARQHGFTEIQPVSVGYGHAARCAVMAFGQAEPHNIGVFGFAPQSFKGFEGEQSAVFDPAFLTGSPYTAVAREHQWHVMLPRIFAGLGKARELAADIAAVLKKHGLTTNTRGEPL
ncbi:MAG: hypothetical protein DI585_00125 [Pseudomonas fluorescens]|nr:MAG: hypothetical protein DI585_00125 [Pseudomonas fluorescens]